MIIDSRVNVIYFECMKGEEVGRMETFKYLRIIDPSFSRMHNAAANLFVEQNGLCSPMTEDVALII